MQKLFKLTWKSSYSVTLTLTILYPLKYMMLWQATLGLLDVIVLTFKEKTSLNFFFFGTLIKVITFDWHVFL